MGQSSRRKWFPGTFFSFGLVVCVPLSSFEVKSGPWGPVDCHFSFPLCPPSLPLPLSLLLRVDCPKKKT